MARVIDRTALGAGFAAVCYLFFLGAWDNIPLACAAAFACCALAGTLLRGHPLPRRVSAAQARAELLRIASLEEGEAEAALLSLVRDRYPEERFALAPVLKHPEAAMNAGDVLNAWKAHRSAERLVIASTCPCEPRAALYARELRSPAVAVVDSRRLLRILRVKPASALPELPRPSLKERLRRLARRVASARVTPRNGLVAVAMLATYLLGGGPLYLFAALAVLLHLGVALIHRRAGRRLFDTP